MATRLSADGMPYDGLGVASSGKWTGKLAFRGYAELYKPLRWKKNRIIFVGPMTDLFHENMPLEWIARMWAVMALSCKHQDYGITRGHTFKVLTKRPGRALKLLTDSRFREQIASEMAVAANDNPNSFHAVGMWWLDVVKMIRDKSPWVWPLGSVEIGATVENRQRWEQRSKYLRQIPAARRFISYEPALGTLWKIDLRGIDQMICGGQTGPGAMPMLPEWVREARDETKRQGKSFFFKGWGDWTPISHFDGVLTGRIQEGGSIKRRPKEPKCRHLDGRIWEEN
jgi:protein gp37